MAVKLEKTTDRKKMIKIISVTDSAIDWDASYSKAEDFDEKESEKTEGEFELPELGLTAEKTEMSLLERKKAHYNRHHDESKLTFKESDQPTLFIFHHPHRADVAKRMRELAAGMYSDSQKKKGRIEADMFTAVFHNFFWGTQDGIGGTTTEAKRINDKLTDDYIQALEDAEVFVELNAAFMSIYNQDRTKVKDKHFAEK